MTGGVIITPLYVVDSWEKITFYKGVPDFTPILILIPDVLFWTYKIDCQDLLANDIPLCPLKGTGTRDLIWLKVVSLDRSWLVGLTDDI